MATFDAKTDTPAGAADLAAADRFVFGDITADGFDTIEAQNLLDALLRVAVSSGVLALDATSEKIIVRQRGGTPGTDEVQVYHDGTHGYIAGLGGDFVIGPSFSKTLFATTSLGSSAVATVGSGLEQDAFGLRANGRVQWATSDAAEGTKATGLGRRTVDELEVYDGSTGRRDLAARTLIARQDGGVVGTDEVQTSHDGTNGLIDCKSGSLGIQVGSGQRVDVILSGGGFLYLVGGGIQINSYDSTINWAGTVGLAAESPGVARISDGGAGIGPLKTKTLVEANTAGSGSPNILTAAESRTALTNEGATAENYHTLPTAAAGLDFEFVCQDSDGIRVVANTGDTIRDVGTVSASAGYIRSSTIGSVIRLKAINATEWFVVSKTGTWTIDS